MEIKAQQITISKRHSMLQFNFSNTLRCAAGRAALLNLSLMLSSGKAALGTAGTDAEVQTHHITAATSPA